MKLGFKEKFAYGIGAVGKDMVYMLSASYILYYYQDIMGVSAWVMGIILLIARVFDAFNDPLMGVLVAKTKTKFGKFRPWLFIGTLTNAVVLFFMFAAPPTLIHSLGCYIHHDGYSLLVDGSRFYGVRERAREHVRTRQKLRRCGFRNHHNCYRSCGSSHR